MVDLPDDPVEEWGLDTVKREFVDKYDSWNEGLIDGVLQLTLLNRLHSRLEAENVDVERLLERDSRTYKQD